MIDSRLDPHDISHDMLPFSTMWSDLFTEYMSSDNVTYLMRHSVTQHIVKIVRHESLVQRNSITMLADMGHAACRTVVVEPKIR